MMQVQDVQDVQDRLCDRSSPSQCLVHTLATFLNIKMQLYTWTNAEGLVRLGAAARLGRVERVSAKPHACAPEVMRHGPQQIVN